MGSNIHLRLVILGIVIDWSRWIFIKNIVMWGYLIDWERLRVNKGLWQPQICLKITQMAYLVLSGENWIWKLDYIRETAWKPSTRTKYSFSHLLLISGLDNPSHLNSLSFAHCLGADYWGLMRDYFISRKFRGYKLLQFREFFGRQWKFIPAKS